MKKLFDSLNKGLDDVKKSLHQRRQISAKQLDKMKAALGREFEKSIQYLDSRKAKIQEALAQEGKLKRFKKGVIKTLFPLRFRMLLSAPFIYMMIVPAVIVDFFLEIYQNICFRLYDIPLVKRREHIIFDHHLLGYLNWFEKLNCLYCSYFNGLMSYGREIAGRTERYWCPIKNAKRRQDPHSQYEQFFEYLEGEEYRQCRLDLRKFEDIDPKKKS